MIIIFLGFVSFGGILAGVVYFQVETLENALMDVNFTIPIGEGMTPNENLTNFQDIMELVIYPITGLRTSLPYLTYFMIFAFIISLGITAYVSSKNPVFFIVHLLFTFVLTYFSIILSNNYTTLLEQPFINTMMINFNIYNKIMLYLPQVLFFTSLTFGIIAFISIMKPSANKFDSGLNYGGDY